MALAALQLRIQPFDLRSSEAISELSALARSKWISFFFNQAMPSI
jgi:hypothetical protein